MFTILFGVFVLGTAAMNVVRHFELAKWQVSIGLLILAVLLHVLNMALIQIYIRRNAPELASTDEVAPGVQAWELTAGLGVVPRWVSRIGLLAVSALITAVMPWVVSAVKFFL